MNKQQQDFEGSRRPLKTRSAGWAQALARAITKTPISANTISICSVGFALAGGGLLLWPAQEGVTPLWWMFAMAAACVQLRLLCNLLDGMVAVEGGKSTPAGEFFNDFPDRLADLLFLVPAGLVAGDWPHGVLLGWLAGIAALLTAYVRVLGGAMGQEQDFCGPMAKPHRMFVLTLGLIGTAVEIHLGHPRRTLYIALVLILAGSLLLVIRRSLRLLKKAKNLD